MIEAILFQPESAKCERIINLLQKHCPKLHVNQVTNLPSFTTDGLSNSGQLILYDLPEFSNVEQAFIDEIQKKKCYTIILAQPEERKYISRWNSVCGIVNKPIHEADFVITVKNAIDKMELEQRLEELSNVENIFPKDVIGIPTMEGFEYLKIDSIIRCEGLQRCTRVVSEGRSDIISAYPIGHFKSLLQGHFFYLSHRSHLINLQKVIRYSREGYIFLSNSSKVPLARRNKAEFISQWRHI
ncbi:MAG: LytTR family DNA-binding domain-containing protein [Bacteroidota bacterium]